MTKGDTMTTFSMKISKDRDQPSAIGEIISAPSGMHLYIYYLYHCHEGNCRRKEPFAEVMDPEGSQCIQRNNTLEVKTPGLIVVIVIPLTYIYKFFYITRRCCSCDNNPLKKIIPEMYSLFSFRRYSCFGSSCFLVPARLTIKEDVYPSEGVTWLKGSQNYLRKRKNRTIIEATNANNAWS